MASNPGDKKRIIRKITLTIMMILTLLVLSTKDSYADGVEVDNGIPVIYVTVDESQGTISAMNESPDHSVYCYGTVSIDVPDGFQYSDMQDKTCVDLAECGMSIKGRGNSSWDSDKKPYKLKLDTASDVLGLGSSKHWVLIANRYDRTLLKDRMTAWLGDEIGMAYTPRGVPVDLVMKNTDGTYEEYLGSYYLSEQVRVDEGRIEVEKLKAGDTDSDKITGGYVVQNGMQTDHDGPSYFTTTSGAEWANHTPNFDIADDGYVNDTQKNYIRNYMQEIEDAIDSADFEGETRTSYRDLMDLESAAKYWLVDQACMNRDGYGTGSTYLYKKRGDKIYWGPLWDYDYSWYYDDEYEGFEVKHNWLYGMLYDTGEGGFVQEIKTCWPEVKTALLEMAEDGGIIDKYYEETKLSQAKDLEIYPQDTYGDSEFNPEEAKEELKAWIINRTNWMDTHMNELDNLIHKITVNVKGEDPYNIFVTDGYSIVAKAGFPEVDGYVFRGWLDEDGNRISVDNSSCYRDITITADLIAEDEATQATHIFFREKETYVKLDDYCYYVPRSVLPIDAENQKLTWSVSDETIATVDYAGVVTFLSVGDVDVTATLYSGASCTMTLHIVDEPLAELNSISAEKDVYNMKPGEYDKIFIIPNPINASLESYHYESGDESVVTVDDNGVLQAVAPGKTSVKITITNFDPETYDDMEWEITVDVIVSDENDDPVQDIIYECVEGDGCLWYKNSGKTIRFVYKRSEDDSKTIDHFVGIKTDDNDVSESNYTAEAGSVIIELKPEYLETLTIGKHKLNVLFDDGDGSEAYFEVVAPDIKTDDDKVEDEPEKPADNTDSKNNKPSGNPNTTNVKTGDESRIALSVVLLILSFIGIIFTVYKKRVLS